MFYDVDRPDVTLSDWQTFRNEFPSHLIEEVIDRSQLDLRANFLPLARGGAIASTTLLRKAGYRSGTRQSQCWRREMRGAFELPLNTQLTRGICVRKFGNLWMVRRWHGTPHIEALVFRFGSTPIFTRNCPSAKQLAWYCSQNGLPEGLCWVRA